MYLPTLHFQNTKELIDYGHNIPQGQYITLDGSKGRWVGITGGGSIWIQWKNSSTAPFVEYVQAFNRINSAIMRARIKGDKLEIEVENVISAGINKEITQAKMNRVLALGNIIADIRSDILELGWTNVPVPMIRSFLSAWRELRRVQKHW
jgi:hypothetical protein